MLVELARLRVLVASHGVKAISYRPGPGFGGPEGFIRLLGLELPVSAQLRLKRLFPGSKHVEESATMPSYVDIGLDTEHKVSSAFEIVHSLIGIS